MNKYKKQLLIIILLISGLAYIIFTQPEETKIQDNKIGLWGDCDLNLNNCDSGLECVRYSNNIYKCIKYLNKGEECGRNVAEVCGQGFECANTDKTRTVCGTYSTEGDKECSVESLQVCKGV